VGIIGGENPGRRKYKKHGKTNISLIASSSASKKRNENIQKYWKGH
jgi:hypothetical protein